MAKSTFKQAPLPFIGQKRQFLSHFSKIIADNIPNDGEGWTIIDVFGGSGLLSHNAKKLKPKAHVIYNDFDGYSERILNIKDTNSLREKIYAIVGHLPKNSRLSLEQKIQVLDIIENFNGYKDLNCIASWLLFSGKQINSFQELSKESSWNGVRKTDYPLAEDYLTGIEVTCESFHTLLPKFKGKEKVLLLLDPPYLCADQKSYKQDKYFDLIDFLRLIHLTKPPFIFFSSTKSEFIRFIDYLVENKQDNFRSFENVSRISLQACLNHQVKYEDNLVYKF